MTAPLRPLNELAENIYGFFMAPKRAMQGNDAETARSTRVVTPNPLGNQRDDSAGKRNRGAALSLALVVVVTLAGQTLAQRGNVADIAMLYLIPVIYAGTRHGLGMGLGAGFAASLAYDFFFVPPIHSFLIADPSHVLSMAILIGVALVCSQLGAQARRQTHLARADAERHAALAGFAGALMRINQRDQLWPILAREIGRMFELRVIVLAPEAETGGHGPQDDLRPLGIRAAVPPVEQLDLIDLVAAQWALDTASPTGPGSSSMAVSEWLFHPLRSGTTAHAVLGVAREDAGIPLEPGQIPLLANLLDQAGLALARIAVEEDMIAMGKVQERDRLRVALLSSVGHDLRTPLTTIIGMLRSIHPETALQQRQIDSARVEAERIERFVSNLIDMMRIETGSLTRASEAIDLFEAVAAAIDAMSRALAANPVLIEVQRDLPLVMADPMLLHHCLINLIDNAAKHGEPGGRITVRARVAGEGLALSVLDEGAGIPPGEEQRIFGMFTRIEGSDRRGGTGLGLAIVQGFAQAMGIEVAAANRAGQPGAVFSLLIPREILRAVDVPE